MFGTFLGEIFLFPYGVTETFSDRDCLVVRRSRYRETRAANLKLDHTKKKKLGEKRVMQDLGCAGVVRGKAIWWGGQRGELKRASENAPRSKRDGDEMDRQKKKGTEERKGGKGTVISRTELNEARKGGVMERQTLMFFFCARYSTCILGTLARNKEQSRPATDTQLSFA